MGDEADDILVTFGLSEADRKKYAPVFQEFDKYFSQRRNVTHDRAQFNHRVQQPGESVDHFITELYRLAETCGFGTLKEEMIRDRIVVGLADGNLALKLQLDKELTLQKAVTQARQSEAVKKQQGTVRNTGSSTASANTTEQNIDAVRAKQFSGPNYRGRGKPNFHKNKSNRGISHRPSQNQGNKQHFSNNQNDQKSRCCGRCGKSPPHPRDRCPASRVVCDSCSIRGHYSSMCRTRTGQRVGMVEEQSFAENDEAFLGYVSEKEDDIWNIRIKMGELGTVDFKVDTGADVTLIPESMYNKKRHGPMLPTDKMLFGPGDIKLPVLGKVSSQLSTDKATTKQDVYILKGTGKALLGRPAIVALGILAKVDLVDQEMDTKTKYQKEYPKLFTGLGEVEGEYKIKLKSDAQPYVLNSPRRIALPLMDSVKTELERMVKLKVIIPVQEATDWCSPMVVVPKPNGELRICADLTKLNQSIVRERYMLPTVEHTLGQLTGAIVFTKLDANSGFWQLKMDEESSYLTTFISPFGRYRYLRLPYGISSAPEHFQRRVLEILDGLEGVVCLVDDIVVHGRTQAEHDGRLQKVLKRLEEKKVTLNLKKCKFSEKQVRFLGQIVDEKGVHPDPNKVKAIAEMEPPQNIGELRRFLGMVNQQSKFAPALAEKTKPLRDLLSRKNDWFWGDTQNEAFNHIKKILTAEPVLAFYNPKAETVITADSSSYGLGAEIKQKQSDGQFKTVAYGSRSLTKTEQRYAQIEKEALALTWASERFSDYVLGMDYHLETDHKPLVPLLSTKDWDDITPRIQRFKMRLMRYRFTISHVPGKLLVTADTLSRQPLKTKNTNTDLENDTKAYVNLVMDYLPASDKRIQEFISNQSTDEICSKLIEFTQSGWPNKYNIPEALKSYWSYRSEFSIINGLLLKGKRIVVPATMRLDILEKLHTGHLGVTKCRERAMSSVWWPGLNKQLHDMIYMCRQCTKERLNKPEPLISTEFPERPWQKVATDLFELNSEHYLIIVDYYSRFFEVARLTQTSSKYIIEKMKQVFACHGSPEIVFSDNGPQYCSMEFKEFAQIYGFNHVTSSPRFPQSNGEAERAVKTAKLILKKSKDPWLGIQAYRATEIANGYSPAQLLFSRRIRTPVPVVPSLLVPQCVDGKLVKQKEKEYRRRQEENFNSRHKAKNLEELATGERVWIKDIGEGIVRGHDNSPRSYLVDTECGNTLRRNRCHLVPTEAESGPLYRETDTNLIDQPVSNPTSVDVGSNINDKSTTETTQHPVRERPSRERQMPSRFKDYVLSS